MGEITDEWHVPPSYYSEFDVDFYLRKAVKEYAEICIYNNSGGIKRNYRIEPIILNGWVNEMHTTVPGPDGKLSYGGACFPKDTQALYQSMLEHGSICEVLGATISERNKMRKNENS